MKLRLLSVILICAVLFCACTTDTPNDGIASNDNTAVSGDVETQEPPVSDTADTDIEAEDVSNGPNIEFRILETGYMSQTPILCGDYLVYPTYDQPSNYDERIPLLRIMDINSGEIVEEIAFGANEFIPRVIQGDGNNLCTVIVQTDSETDSGFVYTYNVGTVNVDFECTKLDAVNYPDNYFKHYDKKLAHFDHDIIDVESGEVLVDGEYGEHQYGFDSKTQYYMFPIDESRFVYRTGGYEALPGFGIYDFESKTATDVPNGKDMIPKGYRNGKIYSVSTTWDGFGSELYVTNISTLETEWFMTVPFELGINDYAEYFMPENGEFILIYKPFTVGTDADDSWDIPALLYLVDPDSAEVIDTCVMPLNQNVGSALMLDDDTFAMFYYYSQDGVNKTALMIADITV